MADKDYTAVLLEKILDEVQATNEGVTAMREELRRVPKREEFTDSHSNVKTIKAVVTAHQTDLEDHRRQIAKLELASHTHRASSDSVRC
jgi:hypothetical protein